MEEVSPLTATAGGALLAVWVVPGASRTEVAGEHDGALRVRVAAPASGGAANRALVRFMSTRLDCGVTLVRGAGGRRKQLRVDRPDLESIAAILGLDVGRLGEC